MEKPLDWPAGLEGARLLLKWWFYTEVLGVSFWSCHHQYQLLVVVVVSWPMQDRALPHLLLAIFHIFCGHWREPGQLHSSFLMSVKILFAPYTMSCNSSLFYSPSGLWKTLALWIPRENSTDSMRAFPQLSSSIKEKTSIFLASRERAIFIQLNLRTWHEILFILWSVERNISNELVYSVL